MNCFNDIPHFPEVKFCTIASKSHEGSSIHLKLNLVATQGKLKTFANNALTLFQDFKIVIHIKLNLVATQEKLKIFTNNALILFQDFKIVLRSQFIVLRIHNFLHK